MTIVEYNKYSDIIVEFENGDRINTNYQCFQNGKVKSLYDKSMRGVGYLGEGTYSPSENKIQYSYWHSMFTRCYDERALERRPTYVDKYVCEEWHNFQNFARWFDDNYYDIENDKMELDKDILQKGNKVYSPETCIFVPQRINQLFLKSDALRGDLPIGVNFQNNKYRARCSIFIDGKKKQKHIGYYNTPEKAFYEGYKPFKEAYIKEVAEEYKDSIPSELYNAMYRWIVEIED